MMLDQGIWDGPSGVDPATGLSLYMPVVYQKYPFWWEVEPDLYEALKAARVAAGIDVNDFPDGKPVVPPKSQYVRAGKRP